MWDANSTYMRHCAHVQYGDKLMFGSFWDKILKFSFLIVFISRLINSNKQTGFNGFQKGFPEHLDSRFYKKPWFLFCKVQKHDQNAWLCHFFLFFSFFSVNSGVRSLEPGVQSSYTWPCMVQPAASTVKMLSTCFENSIAIGHCQIDRKAVELTSFYGARFYSTTNDAAEMPVLYTLLIIPDAWR